MPSYIIPKNSIDDEVIQQFSRARIRLVTVEKLYEFIRDESAGAPTVFAMDKLALMTLVRNKSQLLEELPSVITHVPGVVYSPDWSVFASQLPYRDWMEFDQMARKSGKMVTSVDQDSSGDASYREDIPEWDQSGEEISDEDFV